ncbi:MAG: HAD-IA family hydrolase [Thermodesulfobacteria bacterium]|nr:HAD-IA family hydrolase [Thermodesulfobacteriota bacterium]
MDLFRKRLIIFDCDGVLFNSLEANRAFYNQIATQAGRAPLTQDEMAFCHMHTAFDSINFLFKDYPELIQKAFEVYDKIDYADFLQYMTVEPGMVETVSRLKKDRLTAISTNRSTTMPKLIELYNLDSLFHEIVCALDVERPKPHPEGIELILGRLGCDREDAVYVGDSKVDEDTARNADIPLIAYKNRQLDTPFHADSFDDIARLLCEKS